MLTLETLESAGESAGDSAARIRHGFFTRQGGVSGGIYASLNCGYGSDDDPADVTANRARAMARLELAGAALATTYQVHGTVVQVVVEAGSPDARAEADAMVGATPGIALGILTADCAPVLFADPVARVIGAAHAGWRGALAGVLEQTVAAMERLGAHAHDVVAGIGPCIAQASYQVGPEFRARFVAADAANAAYFGRNNDRANDREQFDLEGYVARRLGRLGLAAVGRAGSDTCADRDRFFSYRRSRLDGEPDFGRLLSAIALAG